MNRKKHVVSVSMPADVAEWMGLWTEIPAPQLSDAIMPSNGFGSGTRSA